MCGWGLELSLGFCHEEAWSVREEAHDHPPTLSIPLIAQIGADGYAVCHTSVSLEDGDGTSGVGVAAAAAVSAASARAWASAASQHQHQHQKRRQKQHANDALQVGAGMEEGGAAGGWPTA